MESLDARGLEGREINARLRELAASGVTEVTLLNPHSVHNLLVGFDRPLRLVVEGSVGFYAGGFMQGPSVLVRGNAGWYTGDNMVAGELLIEGSSGSNLGASMLGGSIRVRGRAGNRVGYGLRGGTLLVEGSVGLETGKMMLGGRIIVLGGAGHTTGESMYGGYIHVWRGRYASLGGNVLAGPPEGEEATALEEILRQAGLGLPAGEFVTIRPRPGKHQYVLFRPVLARDGAAARGQIEHKG